MLGFYAMGENNLKAPELLDHILKAINMYVESFHVYPEYMWLNESILISLHQFGHQVANVAGKIKKISDMRYILEIYGVKVIMIPDYNRLYGDRNDENKPPEFIQQLGSN